MTDKLKGAFRGCPHHGDEYEDCIQHSGTAPRGAREMSKAQQMADTLALSRLALARLLVIEREQNAALLHLLADIRAAAGVNGKLMQDELVDHIARLSKKGQSE